MCNQNVCLRHTDDQRRAFESLYEYLIPVLFPSSIFYPLQPKLSLGTFRQQVTVLHEGSHVISTQRAPLRKTIAGRVIVILFLIGPEGLGSRYRTDCSLTLSNRTTLQYSGGNWGSNGRIRTTCFRSVRGAWRRSLNLPCM